MASQEMGEPLGRTRAVLRLLQLVPDSQFDPRDTGHGSKDHGSRVGSCGTAGVGVLDTRVLVCFL